MSAAPIPTLSDDARFELSLTAAARERRNRPRHLTVMGGVAFAVAALTLWASLSGLSAARRGVAQAKAQAADVGAILAQLEELRGQEPTPGSNAVSGSANVLSTLPKLAVNAGLRADLPIPQDRSTEVRPNEVRRDYPYRDVRSPTIQPLINWMALAVKEVPGLQVARVSLKSTPAGWTMSVTFTRLEQLGATPPP